MVNQLTNNAEALRLFFTEDIYLVANGNEITIKEELALEPQKPKTVFNYLGKNQKNILILVNDSQNDVSTEQGRELLRKLVKAINLTANDFALVNYSDYTSEKYNDLLAFFNCKLMIAFGVNAVDLNVPAQPLHQLINYEEATLLFAENLHDLDTDQASKKILWTSLQQLK
ncbi:MAG: hypothetical protein H7202_03465 [Pedobacter sp.]|nr:hypothetical protein [Pedobacter sp.]